MEFYRNLETPIREWIKNPDDNASILISGPRLVGKTSFLRHVLESEGKNVCYVDLNEDFETAFAFMSAKGTEQILNTIRLHFSNSGMPDTYVFFDGIDAVPSLINAMRELVREGSYRYVMAGSLYGIDIEKTLSYQGGFIKHYKMYPLSFFEFVRAIAGVKDSFFKSIEKNFLQKTPIPPAYHNQLTKLFYEYLLVGGMPDMVKAYIASGRNPNSLDAPFHTIKQEHLKEIAKYERVDRRLRISDIYESMGAYLSKTNKRFPISFLGDGRTYSHMEGNYSWLTKMGLAIGSTRVSDLLSPLRAHEEKPYFKLYYSDVGILSGFLGLDTRKKILEKSINISNGGLFENFAAQELKASGYDLHYYLERGNGEASLLIERKGELLPIKIEYRGKNQYHASFDKVLSKPDYPIKEGMIFGTNNILKGKGISEFPIYLVGLLAK